MFRVVLLPEDAATQPNWVYAYAAIQLTPELTSNVLHDAFTQYISSLYWAFTTLTTVGCASPSPSPRATPPRTLADFPLARRRRRGLRPSLLLPTTGTGHRYRHRYRFVRACVRRVCVSAQTATSSRTICGRWGL